MFIRFTASAFRKLPSIYVFSYFPFGFEGRMWDLIVSVPDHCLSFYFGLLDRAICLECPWGRMALCQERKKENRWRVILMECSKYERIRIFNMIMLTPPYKTTFPSPGWIHGNSGRVCKNN